MAPRKKPLQFVQKLSSELLDVFCAFAPEGESATVVTKVFDWSHDLSKLPESPDITRFPSSPVAITLINRGGDPLRREFDVFLSWRIWNDEENCSYTRLWGKGYPMMMYGISSSSLKTCTFGKDPSEEFGGGNTELKNIHPRFDQDHRHGYGMPRPPASASQELVEIGRLLARDLKLDVEIPDFVVSRGRSR